MQSLPIILLSFISIKAGTEQIAPLSGAICGKLGTTYLHEPTKKSGRFPTRFRRDQTRQQVLAGTARNKERKPPPRRQMFGVHRLIKQSALRRYPVQCASNWEQSIDSYYQRNRVASRPDFVATKRGSNWSAGLSPAVPRSGCDRWRAAIDGDSFRGLCHPCSERIRDRAAAASPDPHHSKRQPHVPPASPHPSPSSQ